MELEYDIFLENEQVKIEYHNGKSIEYELQPLPHQFLQWQSEARLKMYEQIQLGGVNSVKTLPAHLPVLATQSNKNQFVNLATKGLGLLPKKNKVHEFLNLFIETKNLCNSQPWESTIKKRMETVIKYYKNLNNFDPYFLGGLEIFEGTTFKNIARNPLVSLLYTGTAPKFLSFQIHGIIKIIQNENLYYQFLLSARELFAFDSFHVIQSSYPFGYLFYIVNIKEKTPFSRK
ncbi:MAG: hypothetical protein ACFFB0_19305 [Promethearchaeota archaeon]